MPSTNLGNNIILNLFLKIGCFILFYHKKTKNKPVVDNLNNLGLIKFGPLRAQIWPKFLSVGILVNDQAVLVS